MRPIARCLLLAVVGVAGCPRPSAPTIGADPSVADASPADAAKTPPPDADVRIGNVLQCAPRIAGDDCFGNPDFPLHCSYVGTTKDDEAKLWDAVWRDGKHHAAFDAIDAFGAAKSPRLADARCLRAGPDTDYNMFQWCCRASS